MSAKGDLGIVFLELCWEDTTSFSIPESDLVQCVKFVHEARLRGGSVLVHCAQVRIAIVEINYKDTGLILADKYFWLDTI